MAIARIIAPTSATVSHTACKPRLASGGNQVRNTQAISRLVRLEVAIMHRFRLSVVLSTLKRGPLPPVFADAGFIFRLLVLVNMAIPQAKPTSVSLRFL